MISQNGKEDVVCKTFRGGDDKTWPWMRYE